MSSSNIKLYATIILTQGYSWLAASLLTETWRVANRVNNQKIIDWSLTSWKSKPVTASNGIAFPSNIDATKACLEPDLIIVIASEKPQAAATKGLLNWLKKMDSKGSMIGGIDTGAEILAEAGLLESHSSALHHEAISAFRERYLGLGLSYGLYTIGKRRATCAGGVATLDFSLALIARFVDHSLAQATAESLIYARRQFDDETIFDSTGKGWIDDRLTRAVRHLSSTQNNDFVSSAANVAGVSPRTLQRMFVKAFGKTPRQYVVELKLRRARSLLTETSLSIQAIALAVGFSSGSELSRAWKREFNTTPGKYRSKSLSEM